MQSSEQRKIALRARLDLVISESIFQGEKCWIIKDPLSMKYFRLQRPEYLVLTELQKETNYEQLRDKLQLSLPSKTVKLETVQQLVVNFHRNGLLLTDAVGQSKPLKKKRNKELKQKTVQLLSSVVSLRLPGFDPDPILNWLYPKVRWFFSGWMTFVVGITCLSAVLLLVGNLNEFYSRLPEFQNFFAFENLLFMSFVLIFTKSIHEFGHGLMCKHFGGECHEIGFMFLVFTPAMYCNTSDSWIMPNRWHRIAIGAAGMYVELFLAAICTFIWWYSHPGWLHYFCLNLMFLSSVSAAIFNLNPLLRYDGYYMLSDFLEIPNLAQKSKKAMLSKLRVWLLGMKPMNSRTLPKKHHELFAAYSVASFTYRWFIMIAIFWFLSEIFEPWGLEVIGKLAIGVSLIAMIGVPMWKLAKFLTYPGRLRDMKRTNVIFTTIAVSCTAALILFVKFPHHVTAHFVLQPSDAQQIFVSLPGNLAEIAAAPGDTVYKGQLIAQLENLDIKLQLEELRGELSRLKNELLELQLGRIQKNGTNSRVGETVLAIEDVKQQIKLKKVLAGKTSLYASKSGVIFPAPNIAPSSTETDSSLKEFVGTPLDPANLNAYLPSQTLVCVVGSPDSFEAVMVVHESDVQLLKQGQRVILLLEQYRHKSFIAELHHVSNDELTQVPRELSQTNGGPLAVSPDGTERPILKHFEAKANFTINEMKAKEVIALPSFHGIAKIRVGNTSVAERVRRALTKIINFR